MKKVLLSLFFIVSGLFCAMAQGDYDDERGYWDRENPHSVSVSVGAYPLVLGYTTQLEFKITSDDDPYTSDDGRLSPSFNLSYGYRVNKVIEVDLLATYITYATKYYDNPSARYAFTSRDNVFLFTPTIRANWLNYRHFSLYSSFGIGLGYSNSTNAYGDVGVSRENICGISAQFTPFGWRYTAKRFFGFCELGLGTVGVVRAGVGFKL